MNHSQALKLFSTAFPNATPFEQAEVRLAVMSADPKQAVAAIRESWQKEKFAGDAVRRIVGLLKRDGSKARAESLREESARHRAEAEAERDYFAAVLARHTQTDIDQALAAVTEAAEPELRFVFARGMRSPLVAGLVAKWLAAREEVRHAA